LGIALWISPQDGDARSNTEAANRYGTSSPSASESTTNTRQQTEYTSGTPLIIRASKELSHPSDDIFRFQVIRRSDALLSFGKGCCQNTQLGPPVLDGEFPLAFAYCSVARVICAFEL
jgi:hypothetical protein